MSLPFWSVHAGRELDATPLTDVAWPTRIVACLNVWNDFDALQSSVPTWKSFVDHVIVVDGSYDTHGSSLSTDRTREYLRAMCDSVEFLNVPGQTQCDKRTAYCSAATHGDCLFIIDADEEVEDGLALRNLPVCDVGWIRMRSPLYTREQGQPRILRWRSNLHYAGRHHWIYDGDRLLCTHQYGGPGYIHRPINLRIHNTRSLNRSSVRISVKRSHLIAQNAIEHTLSATPRTVLSDSQMFARESLQICNIAYRDDGLAPSRFHTAINRTTPHSSAFFKTRPGPFDVPTQYSSTTDYRSLAHAINTCDVVHFHTVMSMAHRVTRQIPNVFHHHGSILRANADRYMEQAEKRSALVLVSNLELLSWTGAYPAFYLPNPMPVARYRALRDMESDPYDPTRTPFYVCHSPTKQHRKGTKEFLRACEQLASRGIPIVPVLIENKSHAETLHLKATCHAAFDSFWLGMQCSGLEAASMGLPVIAGDLTVAERYREFFGVVPYTFANSQETLEFVLERLVMDADFRSEEATRVHDYVTVNHDESAVALTYLDYLDRAFQWRSARLRHSRIGFQSSMQGASS